MTASPENQTPDVTLLAKVGDGGMATVWKAIDNSDGRTIAVKVLNRESYGNVSDMNAFKAEALIMKEIRHPGVVEAYSYHDDGRDCSFLMEFVDGYNFGELLRRKQHVKEEDCLLICESVASALDFAWNDHGIVHCDLKPENIMINSDGVVKLTDLGISHRFQFLEGAQEVPDHVLGTPAYISPEQVFGDVELDCRSDIYSLAATLYHLATGRVLFPGLDNDNMMRAHCNEESQALDPRAYRPELSEGFCQLLESMLVKNRDYRISTWQSVYTMCRDVENGIKFKPRAITAAHSSVKLMTEPVVAREGK